MAKASTPIPEGFHTLTPHLAVSPCDQYIEFLKKAFNAVELGRSAGPGGKLMHALVRIGNSHIMLHDLFPEMGASPIAEGQWPMTLNLYVEDCDALFNQAVAAGCTVKFPLADQFWGDRYGQVKDPFNFDWAIATRKETLTPEEMKERQKAAFSGAKS
jgi:uncharacterized glyoxalase superfamily protein PhnB